MAASAHLQNFFISILCMIVANRVSDYMTGYETPIACGPGANDFHWNGTYLSRQIYPSNSMKLQSTYVTMEDGVKLAVDTYVSEYVQKYHHTLPTIVHLTRHGRAYDLDFPFNMFSKFGSMMNPRTSGIINRMTSLGYAWVVVDVRGTGASYGAKKFDFSAEEADDSRQILNWIVAQPWSNGEVATYGLGFDGVSSLLLASTGHPSLKAVVLNGAPADIYNDAFFPGGVMNMAAIKMFSSFTQATDSNERWGDIPSLKARMMMNHFGGSMYGVNGNKSILRDAVSEHTPRNLTDELMELRNRDDKIKSGQLSFEEMDVRRLVGSIVEANVPIYSFGGYYDMGVARSSLSLFQSLKTGLEVGVQHRVTLGPWSHAGVDNADPFAASKQICFSHVEEMSRFFDYHLYPSRRKDSRIAEEKPIHYFTLVENVWKSSTSWPPGDMKDKVLYFSQNSTMVEDRNMLHVSSESTLNIDYTQSTLSKISRWAMIDHLFLQRPWYYYDREVLSQKTVAFVSETLPVMEITGEAELRLHFSVNAPDVALIAYLEDVDYAPPLKTEPVKRPGVTYITEAVLRPSHRASTDGSRSFDGKDNIPLVPGKIYEAVFKFLPTSYLIKPHHQLRVTIAAADAKNFHLEGTNLATKLTIYHGSKFPSSISLPSKPYFAEEITTSYEADDDEFSGSDALESEAIFTSNPTKAEL